MTCTRDLAEAVVRGKLTEEEARIIMAERDRRDQVIHAEANSEARFMRRAFVSKRPRS